MSRGDPGTGLRVDVRLRRGDFDLDVGFGVAEGVVTAIVGPNGAGKSTILRCVAGLEMIDEGAIRLGDHVLDDGASLSVPPQQRSVGMVFQDYLLFPHLSVRENVAFGLRARGLSAADARRRTQEWLDAFDLSGLAERLPGQISGGQAQRVALVRALITEPRALLLDEPLAALDAGTRTHLRGELSRRLRDFDGVTLLVTHEPLEALVLADHLVVLDQGRVVQQGPVAEVAARPASAYVAALVGVNLLRGHAHDARIRLQGGGEMTAASAPAGAVFLAIRPSAVTVHRARPEGSARNVWPATVEAIEEVGDRFRIAFTGAPSLLVDLTPASVAALALAPGVGAWLSVKATEIDVYPAPADVTWS